MGHRDNSSKFILSFLDCQTGGIFYIYFGVVITHHLLRLSVKLAIMQIADNGYRLHLLQLLSKHCSKRYTHIHVRERINIEYL